QLLVGEIVKRAAHRSPNHIAFKFNEDEISFQQLDNRATHIAGWLQKQNVKHDSKIAFMLRNSIAFSELTFGIALTGGVGVPINFRLGESEIAYILDNSDSEIVF